MAVNPTRRRRATNVEATVPLVPAYETHARSFIRANKAKNLAAADEKTAVKLCNQAMAAANVRSFEIVEGNQTYDAVISADTEEKVSIERLYKLVTEGTVTMEQFVRCVSATQAAVKKELGTNILNSVLDRTTKEEALKIKPRKG